MSITSLKEYDTSKNLALLHTAAHYRVQYSRHGSPRIRTRLFKFLDAYPQDMGSVLQVLWDGMASKEGAEISRYGNAILFPKMRLWLGEGMKETETGLKSLWILEMGKKKAKKTQRGGNDTIAGADNAASTVSSRVQDGSPPTAAQTATAIDMVMDTQDSNSDDSAKDSSEDEAHFKCKRKSPCSDSDYEIATPKRKKVRPTKVEHKVIVNSSKSDTESDDEKPMEQEKKQKRSGPRSRSTKSATFSPASKARKTATGTKDVKDTNALLQSLPNCIATQIFSEGNTPIPQDIQKQIDVLLALPRPRNGFPSLHARCNTPELMAVGFEGRSKSLAKKGTLIHWYGDTRLLSKEWWTEMDRREEALKLLLGKNGHARLIGM